MINNTSNIKNLQFTLPLFNNSPMMHRNKKEGVAFAEIFAALDVAEDSKTFTRVLIKKY